MKQYDREKSPSQNFNKIDLIQKFVTQKAKEISNIRQDVSRIATTTKRDDQVNLIESNCVKNCLKSNCVRNSLLESKIQLRLSSIKGHRVISMKKMLNIVQNI